MDLEGDQSPEISCGLVVTLRNPELPVFVFRTVFFSLSKQIHTVPILLGENDSFC